MESNLKNATLDDTLLVASLEFYSSKRDDQDITFLTMTMKPEQFKELTKNISKILDKALKAEDIDIRKDVRIMAQAFPFKVAAKIGGETYTSDSLNISDEGKVTLQNAAGDNLNLIPASSSYVQHCRFKYNDVNKPEIKYKPECCIHFTNSMGQEEWICSTLGEQCRYQALSILKKMKLSCEKEKFKPLDNSLELPCLIELPSKPLSPV